ncbi:MAG TPA: hypothetical protein VE863_21080 [Pyrinomonadaceae bacterium]|jgi:hypothetical protein|nr:hypothetical protein [Pyrinomonadaceae bacterium]
MAQRHVCFENQWAERFRPPLRELFTILFVLCLAAACTKPPDQSGTSELKPLPISNSPSPTFSPIAVPTPSATQTINAASPPKTDEVVAALARVFDKSATLARTSAPTFLVGDFNGDGSEDIAVITKPNEDSLGEINNELANWVLEDPHDVPIPGTKATDIKPKPVRAEKADTLLAIIHGAGAQGWRNNQARQTFLLRNAAGADATVQTLNTLRTASFKQKLPPLRGDAILETVNGHRGLIFWTGAKYSWAPEQ